MDTLISSLVGYADSQNTIGDEAVALRKHVVSLQSLIPSFRSLVKVSFIELNSVDWVIGVDNLRLLDKRLVSSNYSTNLLGRGYVG